MPRSLKFPTKILIGFDGNRIKALDAWRRQQSDLPTRSEAIRRLVDLAIADAKAKAPGQRGKKSALKASDLAAQAIDLVDDKSAGGEERARRKRRLIKGPREFRELRGKMPRKD